MTVKLVAYKYVPIGFEMVIENTEGKIWNLWYNVQLTDDPENWDSEVKSINKIQENISELKEDHRLIRAQMAEFCRIHPYFPESIDILCKEIGDERFSNPVKVGCEGRGLLDSLGHHNPENLKKQQKETLESYAKSLKKWLKQDHQKSSIDSKIFGFLGKPNDSKVSWVENLIHIIDTKEPSQSSIQHLVGDACKKKNKEFLTRAREKYLGRPFNCFKCGEYAKCECWFSMFIDSGLLCIGTVDEERSMLDEFRRFTEENILAYSVAINSWLEGAQPKNIMPLITPSYITKDKAQEIANKVHSALREKDDIKIWLTVCLLKTIRSNKRWHKTTELIDGFPEATSWIRKIL